MRVEFYGAAQMVTGSKHLLTLESGKRILLDCGMFQGRGKQTQEMNAHFGFDPREVDILILSHAHIDHSGLIPLLVKEGFKGPIYATPPTIDLCEIMLADSAHIQEQDAEYISKVRVRKGKKPVKPLYTQHDVPPAFDRFRAVRYNKPEQIDKHVELTFTDAGHILGSACVNLKITEQDKTGTLTFTGDIGRYNNRFFFVL